MFRAIGVARSRADGALLAAILLFGVVLLRTAWLCDDAFITLRTIDNATNGYGFRWNVVERVQTYTHPLWLFLLLPVYSLTRSPETTLFLPSVLLSIASISLLAFRLGARASAALLVVLALTSSKAFMDYSTSGLENPLTHLLFILFVLAVDHESPPGRRLAELSFIAALAVLNRMDVGLAYLPLLVLELARFIRGDPPTSDASAASPRGSPTRRAAIGAGLVALGFTPFLLWETFSLFYYGFPFPNPAYAKLAVDVARPVLCARGLDYLRNSLAWDPTTLLTVTLAGFLAWRARAARLRALVLGIAFYLIYLVSIGGDFMSGRFLTLPLLMAAVIVLRSPMLESPRAWSIGVLALVSLNIVSEVAPVRCGPRYRGKKQTAIGIADERGHYFQTTGLLRSGDTQDPVRDEIQAGRDVREQGKGVLVKTSIGLFGYYAGPGIHVVDAYGLADPLISHLPPLTSSSLRVGHFKRAIPRGYLKSLSSGENALEDPGLRRYYDALRLVTRRPLLGSGRLHEIIRINTGHYDRRVDWNAYRDPTSEQVDLK